MPIPMPKEKVVNSYYRSFTKALTWRIVGTLDTIFLSYFVTGKIKIALSIGAIELITKTLLYFIHERIWNKFRWSKGNITMSRLRSFIKSVSWRAIGTIDTIVIAFVLTNDPRSALSIGAIEIGTKIILYYFHERFWNKIKWGFEF
jgi:uncharacterized membrane protein